MYTTIDELASALQARLAEGRYAERYDDEPAFEEDVWRCALDFVKGASSPAPVLCLTSHKRNPGRSEAEWQAFCRKPSGPDVEVLGSKNRLDIVVNGEKGSVGIEVKWLGAQGHAAKLTQALGQALLALENRDRAIVMVHWRNREG